MSATEIIEQIKILSPDEQAKVSEFLHGLDAERSAQSVQCLDREKAQRIAGKIFTEHAELFRKLAE